MGSLVMWPLKKLAGAANLGGSDVLYHPLYLHDENGELTKIPRPIPESYDEKDRKVLIHIRKWAVRMDSMFTVPGTGMTVGLGSAAGLVPVVGDFADSLMAEHLAILCFYYGCGLLVFLKMQFWILLDFLVGLVPFVGDLVDALIKVNIRIAMVFEKALIKKYKEQLYSLDTVVRLEYSDADPLISIPWYWRRWSLAPEKKLQLVRSTIVNRREEEIGLRATGPDGQVGADQNGMVERPGIGRRLSLGGLGIKGQPYEQSRQVGSHRRSSSVPASPVTRTNSGSGSNHAAANGNKFALGGIGFTRLKSGKKTGSSTKGGPRRRR